MPTGARRRSAPCRNFPISGRPLPRAFIRALGVIKQAAALANAKLGLMDAKVAQGDRGLRCGSGRRQA
ncbi:MAG: hypothetical protein WDM77_22460 [Steroidobacteraceae bacterium]